MPIIRRFKKRGATFTVEAYGEVMFMPGGVVYSWTNRFTGRIRAAVIGYAPTNKRPRWGHYGDPLKSSIISSRPQFRLFSGVNPRVYAAVGSTAAHAYYVDQGTGIYAGGSPWKAKILPPWSVGDNSLYEHTWRPGGPGTPKVAPVMIKGQRGQFFFDKGLKRAFQSMRMRSYVVPEGARVSDVLNSAPSAVTNLIGPHMAGNPAFKVSLEQWRTWRDDAWALDKKMNRSRYDSAAALERAQNRAARLPKAAFSKPIGPVDNRTAFLASLAASKKRREDLAKKVADEKRRKAEGERKRAEAEAKRMEKVAQNAKARKFEQARLDAYKYLHVIEKAYPNAEVLIPKSKNFVRVQWTDSTGEQHHQDFQA